MQTVSYTQVGRSGGVDEDDPRYKCCCGIVHVHKGAMIIAIVEVVLSIIVALGGVSGVTSGRFKSSSDGGSYFNCGVTIIVCSLMIYGLIKIR
uniref:Transmembrane protein n=1 Tax=Romanomermis culicivorax TaxID=13658 RepID=A0A915IE84_ROMCU